MKVVTFGELMVRLQPFNYERFVQANSLEFTFGGGEANVKICKFTIESETRSTIIATSAPITSVNFVLIFITHFLLRKDNQFYIHF